MFRFCFQHLIQKNIPLPTKKLSGIKIVHILILSAEYFDGKKAFSNTSIEEHINILIF